MKFKEGAKVRIKRGAAVSSSVAVNARDLGTVGVLFRGPIDHTDELRILFPDGKKTGTFTTDTISYYLELAPNIKLIKKTRAR